MPERDLPIPATPLTAASVRPGNLPPQPSISDVLKYAARRLAALADCDPRLEAEILLSQVLDKPRTHLLAWPEKTVSARHQRCFVELLERRLQGEPLAYITGYREFWSLRLRVTRDTLIPRPETERLVERALQLIPRDAALQIADLGTGSGAIAAAVASERPRCRILATDSSRAALAVAAENFQRLGFGNISCAAGVWCAALPAGTAFDLILSNPPYVAQQDPHLLGCGLPWEPPGALQSGVDGLDDLGRIIRQAHHHLRAGGWLLLEHGLLQGARVRALLREAGYLDIRTHRDLGGRERVTEGRRTVVPGRPGRQAIPTHNA